MTQANSALSSLSGVSLDGNQNISEAQEANLLQKRYPGLDLDSPPPISEYCKGAPSLKLEVGDRAKVVTSVSLRGRSSPEFVDANVVARYDNGDLLDIIYGPVCVKASEETSYWFWYVLDANNNKTWVAEGDNRLYYLQQAE